MKPIRRTHASGAQKKSMRFIHRRKKLLIDSDKRLKKNKKKILLSFNVIALYLLCNVQLYLTAWNFFFLFFFFDKKLEIFLAQALCSLDVPQAYSTVVKRKNTLAVMDMLD